MPSDCVAAELTGLLLSPLGAERLDEDLARPAARCWPRCTVPLISPPTPAGSWPVFGSAPAGAAAAPPRAAVVRPRPARRPNRSHRPSWRRRTTPVRPWSSGRWRTPWSGRAGTPRPTSAMMPSRISAVSSAARHVRSLAQLDGDLALRARARSSSGRVGVGRQVGAGRGRDDLHGALGLGAGDHARSAHVQQHRGGGRRARAAAVAARRLAFVERSTSAACSATSSGQVAVVAHLEHEASRAARAHDARRRAPRPSTGAARRRGRRRGTATRRGRRSRRVRRSAGGVRPDRSTARSSVRVSCPVEDGNSGSMRRRATRRTPRAAR